MSLKALLPIVAVLGLAACGIEPTEVGPGAKDTRTRTEPQKPRVPVKLPPAIVASKQYRCTDNSLVFVDFYSDDLSASIKTGKDAPATRLTASALGEPMVADGYSLKGTRKDLRIEIVTPSKKKPTSCKA